MIEYIEIDDVKIPFDTKWRKIAISLSGGADSALLAYILCEFIDKNKSKTDVHVISHTRMWKTRPWQQHDSKTVFNYLKNRFPNISFFRHSGFVAPELEWGEKGPILIDEYGKTVSGDNIQIRSYSEYICYHENIDAYFNAVTCNPKNVDFKGLKTRDVVKDDSNQHLELMTHMNKVVSHPFRFVEKSWVVKQYKEKGLIEYFNLTRSCEGEFSNITYVNYVPGQEVPACKECFWCKERRWAIEQNQPIEGIKI